MQVQAAMRAREGLPPDRRASEIRDLFLSAKAGNPEALEDLMKRVQVPIHRFLVRLSRNPAGTDDLLQEVLVTLLKNVRRLPEDSNLMGWLFRVATNAFLKSTREEETKERPPARPASPPRAAESREISEVLLREIKNLPLKQRLALLLRVEEGLDYRTISEAIGGKEETVRWCVFDAKRILQQRLRGYLKG